MLAKPEQQKLPFFGIYDAPKPGLPHLVVTIDAAGKVSTTVARSRQDARLMLNAKTRADGAYRWRFALARR